VSLLRLLRKFNYNQAPMGVKQSPDFAQEVMEDIFCDMKDIKVYIDDMGIFANSEDQMFDLQNEVLTPLEDNGFTVNTFKCEWMVQETYWLGRWLTPDGLKPWHKKVEAVLQLQQPPTNAEQLQSFIGDVHYYQDMFPRWSHTLLL
jgi:hypothetical protein